MLSNPDYYMLKDFLTRLVEVSEHQKRELEVMNKQLVVLTEKVQKLVATKEEVNRGI